MKEIESFYPEHLKPFKRNILREYLQYKILEIIYDSKYGHSLSFMGGTAIHLLHSSSRFSEDLDFDNRGLTKSQFEQLAILVREKLQLQGCDVETRTIFRSAFISHTKISGLLYENKLSAHPDEKMIIHIDAEAQNFDYNPEKIIINKFDVFQMIFAVQAQTLLSQKICAIFTRKRSMGRDFYDVVFLLAKTAPDWDYLRIKLQINDAIDLKSKLLKRVQNLDFEQMARDTEPFLYRKEDSKKILHFCKYMESLDLSPPGQ